MGALVARATTAGASGSFARGTVNVARVEGPGTGRGRAATFSAS